MSLTWSYKDWWTWFSMIESTELKAYAWKELTKDNWLKNLPAEVQAEVMLHAPMDLLKAMKHFPEVFKYDCILIVQSELGKYQKKLGIRR